MKTPEPSNENPSAPNSANFKTNKLTPRQSRTIAALMDKPKAWIRREQIDRIAGASNGPQIIFELRSKVTGYDGLDMARMDAVDRDGRPCKPGFYRINAKGRERVTKYLEA